MKAVGHSLNWLFSLELWAMLLLMVFSWFLTAWSNESHE
jgi:hypothetical protein